MNIEFNGLSSILKKMDSLKSNIGRDIVGISKTEAELIATDALI